MYYLLLLLTIVMVAEVASIQVNSVSFAIPTPFSSLRFRGGATEAAPQHGKLPNYVANAFVEPTKAVERSSDEAINVRLVPTEEKLPFEVHPIVVWWFMVQFVKGYVLMCLPSSFHKRFSEMPTVCSLLLLGTPVAESVVGVFLVGLLRCIKACGRLFTGKK